MKTLFFSVLLSSSICFAVSFKATPPKATGKRNLASGSAEVKALTDIVSCVKTKSSADEIRACAKKLLASEVSKADQGRLLAWFAYPFELSMPTACTGEELQFVPKELIHRAKLTLCSQYVLEGEKKTVIFFMSEEQGTFRLQNIKD